MPRKSLHGRGKHSARSKKRKVRQAVSITGAQAIAQNYEPVSRVPTVSAKVLAPRSKLTPVQYPYIATELRRIAILAGIMVVVLVVLYLVIP